MSRCLDIFFVSIALIILSPLLLLTALILRFSGEGEILFRQSRVGLNEQQFFIYKFATMLKNSENIGTGTVTLNNDPRILPVGRWLRKTKVNELPQLFNILLGEMSIIGPRPQDIRCFNAFPKEKQPQIVSVRPGLSGIGSIVFRDEEVMMNSPKASESESFYDSVIMPYKAELEIWFVANQSVRTYLLLIVFTAVAVVLPSRLDLRKWFSDLPPPPSELAGRVCGLG